MGDLGVGGRLILKIYVREDVGMYSSALGWVGSAENSKHRNKPSVLKKN
jgi:hypothetical protein